MTIPVLLSATQHARADECLVRWRHDDLVDDALCMSANDWYLGLR